MAYADMSRTQALLTATFRSDLGRLIYGYFIPKSQQADDLAQSGNYETCELTCEEAVLAACIARAFRYGDIELIALMISRDVGYWNLALHGACVNGSRALVDIASICGPTNWNEGLYGACYGGHKNLAELMVSRGATNYQTGLYYACWAGHEELANLMMLYGANDYSYALEAACGGGHIALARRMIARGARPDRGLHGACYCGQLEVAQLMVSLGATDFNWSLYDAGRAGHRALIDFMLAKGGDPNYGLEGACETNNAELIRFMIARGATICKTCGAPASQHAHAKN